MLATYTEGVNPSSGNTPQCSSLPSELLSQTFRHYLRLNTPYNPEEEHSLGQRCLAEHLLLVCRPWHDAATADSSLWREIILDPEITRVTPYKSLHSYTRVRSIRSRTQLLHVSINNDRGHVKRLAYLKAYYYLVTTMPRWERLFYYLKDHDVISCITIHHLVAPTPNLREVVIRSSTCALVDISEILPETPNLKFLEISMPGIGSLPPSLCKSVTIASIQTTNVRAWIYTLSQLKSIHTLILRPVHFMVVWPMFVDLVASPSFELPSVQTLLLVGPLNTLHQRVGRIKLPALRTLEVDLSPAGAEKQWSKTRAGVRDQLKSLLNAGLQKLVLKSVWFDQWADVVDILQDTKGRVKELVCIDVTCTLQCGKERTLVVDLGATLVQQGAVSPASALSIMDGLLKGHAVELSSLVFR
jgi:hypothetical protein